MCVSVCVLIYACEHLCVRARPIANSISEYAPKSSIISNCVTQRLLIDVNIFQKLICKNRKIKNRYLIFCHVRHSEWVVRSGKLHSVDFFSARSHQETLCLIFHEKKNVKRKNRGYCQWVGRLTTLREQY